MSTTARGRCAYTPPSLAVRLSARISIVRTVSGALTAPRNQCHLASPCNAFDLSTRQVAYRTIRRRGATARNVRQYALAPHAIHLLTCVGRHTTFLCGGTTARLLRYDLAEAKHARHDIARARCELGTLHVRHTARVDWNLHTTVLDTLGMLTGKFERCTIGVLYTTLGFRDRLTGALKAHSIQAGIARILTIRRLYTAAR